MSAQDPFKAHLDWHRREGALIVGVAGGSGSGKTRIAEALTASLGPDQALLLEHDHYYRDLGHLPPRARARQNFDHPEALETPLLVEHLDALRRGQQVVRPVYDFNTHLRAEEVVTLRPAPVIVVEGILVLAEPALRERMDLKVFVDTPPDLRVLRRIIRDERERGRPAQATIEQYLETVRPMHQRFVEPSRRHADLIIPEGYNAGAVATVIGVLKEHLRRQASG